MNLSLESGPRFTIIGSTIKTQKTGKDIVHESHGVVLTYSSSEDRLTLQSADDSGAESGPTNQLRTQLSSDQTTLFVSANENLATHVALRLAGGLGQAANLLGSSQAITELNLGKEELTVLQTTPLGPAEQQALNGREGWRNSLSSFHLVEVDQPPPGIPVKSRHSHRYVLDSSEQHQCLTLPEAKG